MFILESSKVLGYRYSAGGGGHRQCQLYTIAEYNSQVQFLQYKGFKVKGVQSTV